MNVLTRTTRRASLRALVGMTAVALATGAAVAPAAHAANVPADAAHTGLYGAASANYDGVYRQSLAILALHAAGEDVPAAAEDWLLAQQCADHGFSSFNATPSQPCAAYDGSSYTGGTDTNATALAVQALLALGDDSAANAAAGYLKAHQNADGGWQYTPEDTGPYAGSDPNSTGLVLTALNAAGLTPTIDPVDYYLGLQVGRTGVPAQFAGDEGGITSAYSGGYGDAIATPQIVPGLIGDDLVDPPSPSLSSWTASAAVVGTPPATATGVSDWASSWLADNLEQGTIGDGYKAWAILSLASTATGRTAAQDTYEDLKTNVAATNPGALAQTALAAVALGETADAQRDASLIAATLTTAAGRDAASSSTYGISRASAWTGQTVSVTNPYVGTDLPLTQTVIWGDGETTALTGATATHTYATAGTYKPIVRVSVTGYARPGYASLGSVEVVAPGATVKLSKAAAWLGTAVTVTKSAVTGAPTGASIAWGDGATSSLLTVSSATHTYKKTGTFTPHVTLTNGTGGSVVLSTTPGSVKVTKDTGKPTVALTPPASRTKVSSWRTLKGTSADTGTGVKNVTVKLVEKRGSSWYAYNGKTWTKKASYSKALAAAKKLTVTPAGTGAWKLNVAKLTKGTLTVHYFATDKAGNVSGTKTATETLKK